LLVNKKIHFFSFFHRFFDACGACKKLTGHYWKIMILDNKNENQKVYEWLREYTESGKIDIVTGYSVSQKYVPFQKVTFYDAA